MLLKRISYSINFNMSKKNIIWQFSQFPLQFFQLYFYFYYIYNYYNRQKDQARIISKIVFSFRFKSNSLNISGTNEDGSSNDNESDDEEQSENSSNSGTDSENGTSSEDGSEGQEVRKYFVKIQYFFIDYPHWQTDECVSMVAS